MQPQTEEGRNGDEEHRPADYLQREVFPLPPEDETEGKNNEGKRDQKRRKTESLEEKAREISAYDPHPIMNLLASGGGVGKERGIRRVIRDQTQKEEDRHGDQQDPYDFVL
jgi:hypothetical protein